MGAPRPAVATDGTLPAMESDAELLRRLRAGDERAFVALVERYNGSMLRLALSFVPSRAIAEEVVQDTWLAVLRGPGRVRGPVVAEDVAVLHPGEPGAFCGGAGIQELSCGRRGACGGRVPLRP